MSKTIEDFQFLQYFEVLAQNFVFLHMTAGMFVRQIFHFINLIGDTRYNQTSYESNYVK